MVNRDVIIDVDDLKLENDLETEELVEGTANDLFDDNADKNKDSDSSDDAEPENDPDLKRAVSDDSCLLKMDDE
jgi:hypothetical protein